MKVGTDVVDLQSASSIPDYHAYETVVVLLSDVSPLKENLMELCDWVSEGGNVLFAMTLQKTAYSSAIEQKLGIISSGYENTTRRQYLFCTGLYAWRRTGLCNHGSV